MQKRIFVAFETEEISTNAIQDITSALVSQKFEKCYLSKRL